MYLNAVYLLVNGGITRQKQQISEKGDITQHDIVLVSINSCCFVSQNADATILIVGYTVTICEQICCSCVPNL